MQKTIIAGLCSLSLLLVACSGSGQTADPELLDNPLYAEWYYKDIVENMMNLEIQNDPLIKEADTKAVINATRKSALSLAQEATAARQKGKVGTFIPVMQEVTARVLLTDSMLFFGPDTDVIPGAELHVYLSPVLDPRAETGAVMFPDASAIDLGVMKDPYGASSYALPQGDALPDMRSVVLWDRKLKRLVAFAQLQVQR